MAARKGLYIRRVLARNVRRYRDARGMNQTELADAADLSQSRLSKIESAALDIKISTVQRLASALGMPVAALFDETK
jgi:transcriptional regulator with XRE-family HTH domain